MSSYIRRTLGDMPVHVVTFVHREQGLIVAPGNPLNIQSLDDLPRLRYVNRQRGAGTRVLLDYELAQRGIDPDQRGRLRARRIHASGGCGGGRFRQRGCGHGDS